MYQMCTILLDIKWEQPFKFQIRNEVKFKYSSSVKRHDVFTNMAYYTTYIELKKTKQKNKTKKQRNRLYHQCILYIDIEISGKW